MSKLASADLSEFYALYSVIVFFLAAKELRICQINLQRNEFFYLSEKVNND
jgi:hypothetical protein